MIAVLQRVSEARVLVQQELVGEIGPGLLVLLCAEHADTEALADRMLAKMLKLRIFSDRDGKMNHSLQDMDGQGTLGGLLLVSQFTLAAELGGGNRPGFTAAARPEQGRRLFDHVVAQARLTHGLVQTGRFATEMRVELVNDGPVTIPMHMTSSDLLA
jgi:D-tyrosyl-tRNA(Tyr) deacylase